MQKAKSSMKMNKMAILLIVLIVWAVFSIVFMARDYWQEFKLGQMQTAFNQGVEQSIGQIMQQAKTCQPVNLYSGDTQVNLIDVACLQQTQQDGENGGEVMDGDK